MSEIIFQKARSLSNEALYLRRESKNQEANDKFNSAQNILLAYLEKHPQSTEGWLLLTMVEYNPPLQDPFRIIDYTNNIISYDPSNAYALLLQAYAYYALLGPLDDELYEKLNCAKNGDWEVMSMIEFARAWYFEQKNDAMNYEISLIKSTELSSFAHQKNLTGLGMLCLQQGNIEEGKKLINRALTNVKKIEQFGDSREPEDATSIQQFFDYYYKGIVMQDDAYSYLKSMQ